MKDSKTYKKQKFTNVIKNLQGIKIANKNALYQTFKITWGQGTFGAQMTMLRRTLDNTLYKCNQNLLIWFVVSLLHISEFFLWALVMILHGYLDGVVVMQAKKMLMKSLHPSWWLMWLHLTGRHTMYSIHS